MKLMVAIPAFNEAKVIFQVIKSVDKELKKLPPFIKKRIVVIDDGSTDQTGTLAQKVADVVLSHIVNLGLGASLRTAFEYANINHFDLLVTFDADGQHRAGDIWRLLQPLLKNKADVVIGSRMLGLGSMPLSRKLVNILANWVTVLSGGTPSSDTQSGLRAFNKHALTTIKLRSKRMEVSSEVFLQIRQHGLRLTEIPIEAVYTNYSQNKGQSIADAPAVFLRLLFRIIR